MPLRNDFFDDLCNELVIISGGQTGVERAALDVAREEGVSYGGSIPSGRIADDGPLSEDYVGMYEMPTASCSKVAEQNVLDSDMTFVICHGDTNRELQRTIAFCEKHDKPYLVIDPKNDDDNALFKFFSFFVGYRGNVINITGQRASDIPGIYVDSRLWIDAIISTWNSSFGGDRGFVPSVRDLKIDVYAKESGLCSTIQTHIPLGPKMMYGIVSQHLSMFRADAVSRFEVSFWLFKPYDKNETNKAETFIGMKKDVLSKLKAFSRLNAKPIQHDFSESEE